VSSIKCCTRSKWTVINVGGVKHIDTSPPLHHCRQFKATQVCVKLTGFEQSEDWGSYLEAFPTSRAACWNGATRPWLQLQLLPLPPLLQGPDQTSRWWRSHSECSRTGPRPHTLAAQDKLWDSGSKHSQKTNQEAEQSPHLRQVGCCHPHVLSVDEEVQVTVPIATHPDPVPYHQPLQTGAVVGFQSGWISTHLIA
jgi:hypothetical protein